MMDPDETGFTVVWTRDNSTYRLPPEIFEDLKATWMAGKPFFECKSYWGAPMVIRLGSVESIQFSTPESIKLYKDEIEAEKFKND